MPEAANRGPATTAGRGRASLAAISGIDYVVLLCDDVPRMLAFYRDVLRFPVRQGSADWIELAVGGTTLALRPRGRRYDGPASPGGAGVQLAFRVPFGEVAACHEELRAAGVRILQPPEDHGYGHFTLFFADPENNVLEIYAET